MLDIHEIRQEILHNIFLEQGKSGRTPDGALYEYFHLTHRVVGNSNATVIKRIIAAAGLEQHFTLPTIFINNMSPSLAVSPPCFLKYAHAKLTHALGTMVTELETVQQAEEDSVTLTFLGVGNSASLLLHNNSMLITRNHKHMMIGCGVTAKRALDEQGMSAADLDAIVITHIHADHVGGLERIAFDSMYLHNGHRIKLYVTEDIVEALWNTSLKGGMEFTGSGAHVLADYFDVVIMEDQVPFLWESLELKMFPTPHVPNKPSYGILADGYFCYTSDSNVLDAMDEMAKNVSYVFHDTTFIHKSSSHAYILDIQNTYAKATQGKLHVMRCEDASQNLPLPASFGGRVKQGSKVVVYPPGV